LAWFRTPSAAFAGRPGRDGFRLATLCGSVKPLFSGTDDYEEQLTAALRQRGVSVYPIEPGGWGLDRVPAMLRAVAATKPDAILMQYPTDSFGPRLGPHAFAALQWIAPLVVTLHEFRATHPARRASLLPLLGRARAIIATAELERDALASWYPWLRARTHVIPIGANIEGGRWAPRERPMVVYFGQIRPEKGLEEFLACHDALAARFPDAEFVIIGSRAPKFSSYHDRIAQEAERRGITVLGGLTPGEVSIKLREATVALLPFPSGASFRRGSLLAAAACGAPIVTLHGPDTPPDMQDVLRPVASRDDLAPALAACLSDPATLEAAHRRSSRLAAMVSWDAIADQYMKLLLAFDRRQSAGAPTFAAGAPAP
jgi:glycosyltransferase involved in cell wall biosynthesis